eukprot:gene18935-25502_t
MMQKFQSTAGASVASASSSKFVFSRLPCRRQLVKPCNAQGGGMPDMNAVADPDNLFGTIPMQKGIIQKRLIERQVKKSNKDFKLAIEVRASETGFWQLVQRMQKVKFPHGLLSHAFSSALEFFNCFV